MTTRGSLRGVGGRSAVAAAIIARAAAAHGLGPRGGNAFDGGGAGSGDAAGGGPQLALLTNVAGGKRSLGLAAAEFDGVVVEFEEEGAEKEKKEVADGGGWKAPPSQHGRPRQVFPHPPALLRRMKHRTSKRVLSRTQLSMSPFKHVSFCVLVGLLSISSSYVAVVLLAVHRAVNSLPPKQADGVARAWNRRGEEQPERRRARAAAHAGDAKLSYWPQRGLRPGAPEARMLFAKVCPRGLC